MANKNVNKASSSVFSAGKNSKTIMAIIAVIVVLIVVVVLVKMWKAKQQPKMVPLTQNQQQGVDDFTNQMKTYYEQKYQK